MHADAAVQLVSFQIEFPRGRPTRSDSDEALTHAALALYRAEQKVCAHLRRVPPGDGSK